MTGGLRASITMVSARDLQPPSALSKFLLFQERHATLADIVVCRGNPNFVLLHQTGYHRRSLTQQVALYLRIRLDGGLQIRPVGPTRAENADKAR